MATKSHSYGLRPRGPSNGLLNGKGASRLVDSLCVATVAEPNSHSLSLVTSAERSSLEFSKELGSPRSKVHAASDVEHKLGTKKGGKTPGKPKPKRTVIDVTDIEDIVPSESDFGEGEDIRPAVCSFAEEEAVNIRASLLSWYDRSHRVLPWRQNPHSLHQVSSVGSISEHVDPDGIPDGKKLAMQQQRAYEVWVSEIMLQQTRVSAVIDYYHRWMDRWPTLHHLAQASQEEVYSVWAGLGYYRRARFLLEGAKQMVEKCFGEFPTSVPDLLKVHGIGNYTAGAIASIAFDKPAPLVDGNVIRVLCRLRAISDNPKSSSTANKLMWALAKELVDDKRPGDLNQAIMELGATVCSQSSPSCSSCPIASHCKALSLTYNNQKSKRVKSVTEFPVKYVKAPRREEFVAVCVLEVASKSHSRPGSPEHNNHILLIQRPQTGLLAGLWEFPSVPLGGVMVSAEQQRAAMDCYLKDTLGFNLEDTVRARETVGTYVHLFTHIRMHMSIEWLLLRPSGLQNIMEINERKSTHIKWVASNAVGELGLTSGVKKVHLMFLEHLMTKGKRKLKRRKLCNS